jgi:hypothetical protein
VGAWLEPYRLTPFSRLRYLARDATSRSRQCLDISTGALLYDGSRHPDPRVLGLPRGGDVLVTGQADPSAGALRAADPAGRHAVLVDQGEKLVELAGLRDEQVTGAVGPQPRRSTRVMRFRPASPDVVFHAAATHVPLVEADRSKVSLERSGTQRMVRGRGASASRFVLFSTDKAVQPTSVRHEGLRVDRAAAGTGGATALCG